MFESTFRKLSIELEELRNNERPRIAKVIDEARALGDLRDVALYLEKRGLKNFKMQRLLFWELVELGVMP